MLCWLPEFVLLLFGRFVDIGVWMVLVFDMYCLFSCSEDPVFRTLQL